jgi:hypothetical protein
MGLGRGGEGGSVRLVEREMARGRGAAEGDNASPFGWPYSYAVRCRGEDNWGGAAVAWRKMGVRPQPVASTDPDAAATGGRHDHTMRPAQAHLGRERETWGPGAF